MLGIRRQRHRAHVNHWQPKRNGYGSKVPALTLKNLPRDLHRDLKKRAAANHRSLNKEVIAILRSATLSSPDLASLPRDARHARAAFKRHVTTREISAWKRQGRL
jgi:hypothetical protein